MSTYVLIAIVTLAAAMVYFAPSLIAAWRDAPDTADILLINAFTGWSLAGWVIALRRARRHQKPPPPQPQRQPAWTLSWRRRVDSGQCPLPGRDGQAPPLPDVAAGSPEVSECGAGRSRHHQRQHIVLP